MIARTDAGSAPARRTRALLNLALTCAEVGSSGASWEAQDLPDDRERMAAAYESKPAYGWYRRPGANA